MEFPMDTLSQLSEPHSFGSGFHDLQGKCEAQRRGSISDEEVILASSRPKKRAGRKIFRETRHPVYRGVRRRNSNRWVCELREPNKKTRIWLGTHPTLEMAARAHDVAALALRGHLACLNFADSAWRLPVPASKNVRDIQRAATQAAELFRPREFGGVHVLGNESESSTDNTASSESSDSSKPANLNTDFPVNTVYLDEDAIFDMPSLLKDMAQGLLLSPPRVGDWDDMKSDDANVNMQLWSFSV